MRKVLYSSARPVNYNDSEFPSNEANVQAEHWWNLLPTFFSFYFSRISVLFYFSIFIVQLLIDTSLDFRVTLVPILLSLFSSISLDIIRDFRRNKLISRIDNRLVKVLREHQWVDLPIKKVCVGDIVLLHNSDFAPADVVLLSTASRLPIAIDTHIIDGSTQLRKRPPVRQIPPEFMPDNICNALFEMEYDRTFETNEPYSIVPPLAAKLKFEGKLTLIKTNTAENPDNNQNQSNNANQQEEITISLNNDQYIERYFLKDE